TVILADRYSVGLNSATVTTDTGEFDEALRSASAAASASYRMSYLQHAVDVYQGRLLPGFYEEWIDSEHTRLSGQFQDAVRALIGLKVEGGEFEEALRLARHAVSVEPLREEAHEQLIRLLAQTGQPGPALRQYRELERLLEAEMGEEPSAP